MAELQSGLGSHVQSRGRQCTRQIIGFSLSRFLPFALLSVLLLPTGQVRGQGSNTLAPPEHLNAEILSLPGETLVPAALGVRTDRKGNSWNVEKNGTLGRVGSTMVNSGLSLSINQQKFETFQPRMTADGKEFVINGRPLNGLPGVQVVRRIRFLGDDGALRFLEIFFNGSAAPVTLSIELATSFSGNFKTTVTDRAAIDPVMLGEEETGLLVTPGSSQSNRAFLFVLAGPDSPNKPTISTQSRYGLKFQYQLALQPGETASLAHIVTQTITPSELDRKTLNRLFSAYSLDQFRNTIPSLFSETLINREVGSALPEGVSSLENNLESLEVDQHDTLDTLANGNQTRLLGRADLEAELRIETDFGTTAIGRSEIAAIVGKNRGLRDRSAVYLNDGQVLTGQFGESFDGFFQMNSGGRMPLTEDKLDRLVFSAATATGPPKAKDVIMIQTLSGDRLNLGGESNLQFFGLTPWGELNFTLRDLVWLVPAADGAPGHRVRLRDGTECHVYLSDRQLLVQSEKLGDLRIALNRIQSILPSNRSDAGLGTSWVRLPGNQKIAATIGSTDLPLAQAGQVIDLATESVRRMKRLSEDGKFAVEMWDSSQVEGYIHLSQIEFSVLGSSWTIPTEDVLEWENSGPGLDNANREKIAELITRLGDDAWMVREKATRELGQFGYRAIPMLESALSQNPDPEIRRRLSRVLGSYKDSTQ